MHVRVVIEDLNESNQTNWNVMSALEKLAHQSPFGDPLWYGNRGMDVEVCGVRVLYFFQDPPGLP